MTLSITEANLEHPDDATAIVTLLQAYAEEMMGAGKTLPSAVTDRIIPGLKAVHGCLVLLARFDGAPAGLAISFPGFSTWKASPLLNLHDLAVNARFRGLGVGRKLLNEVERHARSRGCCRLTLEVYEENHRAKQLYLSEGFHPGDPPQEFWTKPLESTDAI